MRLFIISKSQFNYSYFISRPQIGVRTKVQETALE